MVRYMSLNDKVIASVCDGCSNWHICKFSKDVKRAEAEYKELKENANWPECIETTLGCKYKQFVTNWRNAEIPTGKQYEYNGLTYMNTGNLHLFMMKARLAIQ